MIKLGLLILMCMEAYGIVPALPSSPKPPALADQEGCYVRDLDKVIPYGAEDGSENTEDLCAIYYCRSDGMVDIGVCGAIADLPPNCHLKKNKTLGYPKCCGSTVCECGDTVVERELPDDCRGATLKLFVPPPAKAQECGVLTCADDDDE